MKNIFKKYRVKEINGKFIPQRRDIIFWEGICKSLDYLWLLKKNQQDYCSFDNLADAQTHIIKYKTIKYKYKTKKDKLKYYY